MNPDPILLSSEGQNLHTETHTLTQGEEDPVTGVCKPRNATAAGKRQKLGEGGRVLPRDLQGNTALPDLILSGLLASRTQGPLPLQAALENCYHGHPVSEAAHLAPDPSVQNWPWLPPSCGQAVSPQKGYSGPHSRPLFPLLGMPPAHTIWPSYASCRPYTHSFLLEALPVHGPHRPGPITAHDRPGPITAPDRKRLFSCRPSYKLVKEAVTTGQGRAWVKRTPGASASAH